MEETAGDYFEENSYYRFIYLAFRSQVEIIDKLVATWVRLYYKILVKRVIIQLHYELIQLKMKLDKWKIA